MSYKNSVLNKRQKTHGDYAVTAEISQVLKTVLRKYVDTHGVELSFMQQESLDLFCMKIARIVSGNPNEAEHWIDLAGYANLISERLK